MTTTNVIRRSTVQTTKGYKSIMALTREQSERLAELEAEVEAGISGLMIEVYLPNFSDDAIWKLARWGEKIADSAPALAEWLHSIAVEEIYRRASKRPVEAKTPRLPVTWANSEVADALLDAYKMAAANGLKELDGFFSELNANLAVIAASRLKG